MRYVTELFTDMKKELVVETFCALAKENEKNAIYLISITKKKIIFTAQNITANELLTLLNEMIYDIAFEKDINYSSFIRVYESNQIQD
jgi:predicted DNA-binding ribbon-helix-helix protein